MVCMWSSSARVDQAWRLMFKPKVRVVLASGLVSDLTALVVNLLVELSTHACIASEGQAAK
jgi:hypothetical protein